MEKTDPFSLARREENKKEKKETMLVCAWCKKVKTADGTWKPTEIPDGEIPSHGICPECVEKIKKKIKSS